MVHNSRKAANVFKAVKVINDDDRTFSCWGSVEVFDRHKELIPIEEFKKFMHIWMDRGAPLTDNHSNRIIGRGLNYEFREKNGKPGVLITGKIYRNYPLDDEIWSAIKAGKKEGLSIGGAFYGEPKETEEGKILQGLVGYEFSVVDRCGNQGATFEDVNMLAKSVCDTKDSITKMVKKKNFKKQDEEEMLKAVLAKVEERVEELLEPLQERIDEIEEIMSGSPEDEESVEMNDEEEVQEMDDEETEKEYDEEEKGEEEEVEEGDEEDTEKYEEGSETPTEEANTEFDEVVKLKKALRSLKKDNRKLKKKLKANKFVKTSRPSAKVVSKSKNYDNMAVEIALGNVKSGFKQTSNLLKDVNKNNLQSYVDRRFN